MVLPLQIKTNLAIKIASEVPSVIINADSMQVYKDLQILSNRPSKSELEGIENKLFGVIGNFRMQQI